MENQSLKGRPIVRCNGLVAVTIRYNEKIRRVTYDPGTEFPRGIQELQLGIVVLFATILRSCLNVEATIDSDKCADSKQMDRCKDTQ